MAWKQRMARAGLGAVVAVSLLATVAGTSSASSADVARRQGPSPKVVADCTGSASASRRWVAFIYLQSMGRCPTAAESEYGITKMGSESTRYSYTRTRFRSKEGAKNWISYWWHVIFLDDPLDPATAYTWLNKINAGTHIDEYVAAMFGSNKFWTFCNKDPYNFVAGMYEVLLERDPGSEAEYQYWIQKMATTSRAKIALQLIRTSEVSKALVNTFGYSSILHRAGPPDKLAAWAKHIRTDMDQLDIMARFAATAEAVQKVGSNPEW